MICVTITKNGPKVVIINDGSNLKKNIEDFLEYQNKNGQPKKTHSIRVYIPIMK